MKFQGQALAKVNIGNVLDSCGDWAGALQAFEEGYRQYLRAFLSTIIIQTHSQSCKVEIWRIKF